MGNPFAGVEKAQVARGGVYFLPGTYKVEVKSVKLKQSRKKDDLLIIETLVLESDNADRPAGSCPSQVINFKHDAALGNVKAFVAAGLGLDATKDEAEVNAQVTGDLCNQVCSDDQPFAGLVLNLSAVNIETREGNEFTIHNWSPSPELLAELAKVKGAA